MTLGSDHKFASNAALSTDVVVLDQAPKPLPVMVPSRKVVVDELLPTFSGTSATAVGNLYTDMGYHITQSTLAISIQFLTDTKADSLFSLFTDHSVIYYTPDGGSTIYALQWADGASFKRKRDAGVSTWYSVDMNFFVLSVT